MGGFQSTVQYSNIDRCVCVSVKEKKRYRWASIPIQSKLHLHVCFLQLYSITVCEKKEPHMICFHSLKHIYFHLYVFYKIHPATRETFNVT